MPIKLLRNRRCSYFDLKSITQSKKMSKFVDMLMGEYVAFAPSSILLRIGEILQIRYNKIKKLYMNQAVQWLEKWVLKSN